MSKRIALLFAGQGAQTVGMGKDLAAHYPEIAEFYRHADFQLGRPISELSFHGPEAELTQTVHAQPALFVHGLACLMALKHEFGSFPVTAAAGLSLGELTAYTAAEAFSFETGLRLVAERAKLMQQACEATEGAMAAMLGAEENNVRNLAAEFDVDIANVNAPGQIVLSGEASKISITVSMAKEYGIPRAVLLNVAGAYHSRLMNSAYEGFGKILKDTEILSPKFEVISNVDAVAVTEPDAIRKSLQEQITGTVRWQDTIEHLLKKYEIEQFIELGPGGVLAGLVKRVRRDAAVVSISDIPSLRAALAALRP